VAERRSPATNADDNDADARVVAAKQAPIRNARSTALSSSSISIANDSRKNRTHFEITQKKDRKDSVK